ncbi:MAG: N-acetyltransferase [Myxococcales bacterium]|nr:N-acetyltransferase [Myxococcales bacterium]
MAAAFVAATAIIEEPCFIGEGTRIWHFCHVMAGARIGRDCVLGKGVQISGAAVVGDRVKIQNNVSVYDGVILEDDVFLGPSCVLTNVRNPRAHRSQRHELNATRIGAGATVGANATIVCGVTIGAHAFIAAGAVVTRDVAAHALMVGVPARQVGWVGRAGVRLVEAGSELVCPVTKERYREVDGALVLVG